MKRLTLFTALSILILVSAVYTLKIASQQTILKIMGTETRIVVKDKNAQVHIKAAVSRIRQIERSLSRYDQDSEVSRLNRGEVFAPSPDLVRCLALAEKAKKATSGAFNVYYGGKLNLDGIGKGYAAEEAKQLLFKRGVKSAMIDLRSSISVLGGPWRIGIIHPRHKDEILGVITLNDFESLSTSGDYEQGRHIINPKTGKPADLCQSVTVICRDAGMADALSTGIFVLGPKYGLALGKKLGIKVLIVAADGKIFRYKI